MKYVGNHKLHILLYKGESPSNILPQKEDYLKLLLNIKTIILVIVKFFMTVEHIFPTHYNNAKKKNAFVMYCNSSECF